MGYTVIPPSQSNQAGMKLFFISLAILASQSVFGLQEASGNLRRPVLGDSLQGSRGASDQSICNQAGPIDIVFVLDGSGSVEALERNRGRFSDKIDFVKQVTKNLNLGPGATRVAVVQYGDFEFKVEIPFTDSASRLNFDSIVYQAETKKDVGTRTGRAIEFATQELIQKFARKNAKTKMIVVTDAKSEDYVDEAANEARNKGIEMIAVGFSKNTRWTSAKICTLDALEFCQLQDIANDPDEGHLFMGGIGNNYEYLVQQVSAAACR